MRINNLVPICKIQNDLYKIFNYTKLINSKKVEDRRYGTFLELEVKSMNEPITRNKIYKKAKMFLKQYSFNENIRKISNNFPLLEQKALEFSLIKRKSINKKKNKK